MDTERRIELPPMEHVEQLASIGQQAQDRQKQTQKKMRPRLKTDVVPEKEEQLRQMEKDGHIDYRA
jgi:hypothetical protein